MIIARHAIHYNYVHALHINFFCIIAEFNVKINNNYQNTKSHDVGGVVMNCLLFVQEEFPNIQLVLQTVIKT